MSIKRFDLLFDLYLHQKINPEQEQELMRMLLDIENEHIVKSRIDRLYNKDLQQQALSETRISRILDNILSATGKDKKVRSVVFKKILAIAASILIILLMGGFFFYQSNAGKMPAVAQTKEIKAPSSIKAFIVLSNNAKLFIDEIRSNTSANIEGIALTKRADGAIEYAGKIDALIYNTLENPQGSKTVNIILSDGSKVWLNSGSKLTYPVSFTERERKVTIAGEALFEVAHNIKRPFIVQKESTQIKVLGTTFNVKAYSENTDVEVTLLKGKVVVSDTRSHRSKVLSPGQQLKAGAVMDVVKTEGTNSAIAWKNESFMFNNQSVEEIGYTLSRWYNIELLFKGDHMSDSFSGVFNRSASLNETVKMLQSAGLQVELKDNKLIF